MFGIIRNTLLLPLGIGLCLSAGAQQGETGEDRNAARDSLELTITLLPENATTPESITRVIELPARAAAEAVERSTDGLDEANDAGSGRNDGPATAAQAREDGREFGQAMRERARESREEAGRGQSPSPPGRPDIDRPPDVPGPPDMPGRPQN